MCHVQSSWLDFGDIKSMWRYLWLIIVNGVIHLYRRVLYMWRFLIIHWLTNKYQGSKVKYPCCINATSLKEQQLQRYQQMF